MLLFGIILSVFVTSFLSGVLGMVGGMILMAIYLALLPFEWAMALHGATQITSNGFRAFLFRKSIAWPAVRYYLAGAIGIFLVLLGLTVRMPTPIAFVLLGSVPWFALALRRLGELDFARPRHAAACGLFVTGAHLTAGVSGPLLDAFFVRGPFDRRQVIGTKAVTQTLGHAGKVLIYVPLVLVSTEAAPVSPVVWPAVLFAALVGTRAGRSVVDRLDDGLFRRLTGRLVLALATICLVRGGWTLVSAH